MEAEPIGKTGGSGVPMLPAVGAPVPRSAPEQPDSTSPFGPSDEVPRSPIPLPNFQQRFQSGESGEGMTPRPSGWETFMLGIQKGVHDTGLGLLYRMGERSAQPEGRNLSPAEANKLYPGRPVPYTTPVDENIARLEYADRQKQQGLDEWVARGNHGAANWTGNLVGSLTDPMAIILGTLSGGLSELALPATAPFVTRAAAHYVGTLGGFVGTGALENLIEHQMGAKKKQLPEIIQESAVPAAIMSGIGLGLGALTRRFLNEGGGTASDLPNIRKTIAALELDQKIPTFSEERAAQLERKAGVNQVGTNAEKVTPTISTIPIQESRLYGATHSDGSPLIHEHGLGPGRQFTDAYDVANNGVARSSEQPGQIGETRLPKDTKLLNLDQAASENGALVKAIEEKTGLSLDAPVKAGQSLKDVLGQIADAAGTHDVPENIMQEIQGIVRDQGYEGYLFKGTGGTNRQVHMFDATGMALEDAYHADPSSTPELPSQADISPDMREAQPAQMGNPGIDKTREFSYSPQIEQLVHEFRKGKTFEPFSPEALQDVYKDIEGYKQQLTELSKDSPVAEETMKELRKQEAQDTRLRDLAVRIAECGAGGGA